MEMLKKYLFETFHRNMHKLEIGDIIMIGH